MNLIKVIKNLQKTELKSIIDSRLKEFLSFKNKNNNAWFSELCFCILTANSKAKTAIAVQKELGHEGFLHRSWKELSNCILRNKHRFHNNKARFIVEARKYANIKDVMVKIKNLDGEVLDGTFEMREWLVSNIKGLGYKEASHFLRNVGYFNFAILDRHIMNLMKENKLIKDKPKTLNKKNYLIAETKFKQLAEKLKMSCAELDLYMWYIKTGKILK